MFLLVIQHLVVNLIGKQNQTMFARKKPIRVELSRKPVLILSPPSPVYINNGLTAYSRLIEDIPASF